MQLNGLSSEMTDFLGILSFIGPQIIGVLFLVHWRKISLSRGIQRGLKLFLIITLILIVACTISFDIYSGIILSSILNGLLIGISFFLILFLAMIIDNYFINTMRRREASHIGVYNLMRGIFEFLASIFLSFI
jgi:predicted transporter